MRCAVLTWRIVLPGAYSLAGLPPSRLGQLTYRLARALCTLCVRFAMSGSDIAHAVQHRQPGKRRQQH